MTDYVLREFENGDKHIVSDQDLDGEISPGVTLRQAIRVDKDDILGWKKAGYHPACFKHKLILKYESDAIAGPQSR